ncbi:MAG: hypothetical protein ACK5WZ_15615 [Pseudobdellovibrionaceae bacterium]
MKKLFFTLIALSFSGSVVLAQGNPVKLVAQVQVGCKNRIEQVTLENFTLAYENGSYRTFRAANNVAHKCGETRWIGADATITIPRNKAKMNSNGVLLSPAVNAQVRCDGKSAWINGYISCYSFYLAQ